MKKPNSEMTDRERILTFLLRQSMVDKVLGGIGEPKRPIWRYSKEGEPTDGQLVCATTSGIRGPHPHEFAWCVGRGDPGVKYSERDVPKIRAIGETEWIWFFNESFEIYNGDLSNPVFLEGWQRGYYNKVLRAMPKAGDSWRYRFGGIRINGESAVLTIRPHIWFATEVHGDKGDKPFTIELPIKRGLKQKEIVALLQAGGFGTKWGK